MKPNATSNTSNATPDLNTRTREIMSHGSHRAYEVRTVGAVVLMVTGKDPLTKSAVEAAASQYKA